MQRFVPKLILPLALYACATERGSVGAIFAQTQSNGRVTVREAPPGYPAADAGMVRGDEILLIDGRDVRSLAPEGIHRLLEGEVGTTVQLTILRRGQIERIALKRAPFARSNR